MSNATTKKSKSKVLFGIIWSYAERFSVQIVSLLVSIVLARILEPSHYGILAIVTVFINIGDALVTGGFGNALVQKKDATDTDFHSICWLSMGISLILYAIIFITAPFIAIFYDMASLTLIIRVMGIRFIISAFNSIQLAYIQRKMQFKLSFIASLIGVVISGVAGVVMALTGFGVWALVAQNLSQVIITTLILFALVNWKPRAVFSTASVRTMWGFGSRILFSTLTYTIKDNIRSLVVGKAFTSNDLAFYNQGKKYPSLLVNDIVDSLGKVLFPVFSEQQDNVEQSKQMMRKSIRMTSFILLPLIFGLIAVSHDFVLVLLTEKWLPCVPYLSILCLVYITRPMSTIFQKAILAIGKSGVNLAHEVITSVITILLIILAVFLYRSVQLIAWSYVIVAIAGTLFFAYFIRRDYSYSIREMCADYLPYLSLSLIMCAVVYAVRFLSIGSLLTLTIQIIVGILVYCVGAKLLRLPEWKQVTALIANVIPFGKKK